MPEHFFIVGAQRCGTTYLHRVLDEHPEVEMAKPVWPEPKFFLDDDQFARGLDWYGRHYFGHEPGATVRGEKSASYLESDLAARRIAAALPGARIVAMLRDPVARAVSNYWYSVENGLETLPPGDALTQDEDERAHTDEGWYLVDGARISVSPFAYRRRGRYVEDLRRYRALFGQDRMHVLVFEATVGSAEAVSGLFAFLGVDAGFRPPSIDRVVNPGQAETEPVPADVLEFLRDYFVEPNAELTAEFGLDLSLWTPRPAPRP